MNLREILGLEGYKINLLGHGKIMQELAKILAPCDIYDDKFSEISCDLRGNRFLPSKMILEDSRESQKDTVLSLQGEVENTVIARNAKHFVAIQQSDSHTCESSAKSCYFERDKCEKSKNLSESNDLKTPPPAPPLKNGRGELLEDKGLCPLKTPQTFKKSLQNIHSSRESKNLFADFFSKKVSWGKPTLKNNTSPSPCGRWQGGGVSPKNESKNPKDSHESREVLPTFSKSRWVWANPIKNHISPSLAEGVGGRVNSQNLKDSRESQILHPQISIVSPGIPPNSILARNAPNIISEYDFFAPIMPHSAWISGTNGKTTTTQMTALLLREMGADFGGNIGTPLCLMDTNAPFWVLETSSFMLHYTNRAKPQIYALLPIEPDHISWHSSFEDYLASKLKPLLFMDENSSAIIPKIYADSPQSKAFKGKIYFYDNTEDLANLFHINTANLRFKGAFLLDSILALAIAKLAHKSPNKKIDYDLINSFQIGVHKIEEFCDKNGRIFVDDSKATNISATIEALKIYRDKRIFLILGGDNKGVSLAPLVDFLRDFRVKIYAIGACENHIKELCAESCLYCEVCGTLKNALKKIKREFSDTKNQICLLSPACASLDQFKSYAERGDLFKKYALSNA